MLTYEYNLDHTVTKFLIPFLLELWIVLAQFCELVGWHCCEPLTSLLDSLLLTSLLENIAHVWFISKIADTLGTNDVTRPFSCNKLIEETQVECLAAIIYEGSDTIFLNFATFVVMVMIVMMVVVVTMFMILVIVMVMLMFVIVFIMMVMLVLVIVFIMMVMMLMLFFIMVLFSASFRFDFLNPAC